MQHKNNEQTVQFLLAEFNEMGTHWRHADQRIETAIRFYVTVWGFFIAGVFISYGTANSSESNLNLEVLLYIFTFAAFVLLPLGFWTARRITSAAILRARYLQSMNYVRRFFCDADPSLIYYLNIYQHLPEPALGRKKKESLVTPSFNNGVVYFIHFLNSLICFLLVFGWSQPYISLTSIILLSVLVMLITLAVSVTQHVVRIDKYRKNNLRRDKLRTKEGYLSVLTFEDNG